MAKTVLVIEDDPAILQLTVDILGLSGYRVERAMDGPEGLACAQTIRPDLVLLDVMLPTLSGLDVARSLRSDPRYCAIPIVLMSGKSPSQMEDRAYDAFIAKPFHLNDLLQTVDRYVAH